MKSLRRFTSRMITASVIRHAANNIEPQDFRREEYETLTETLRTEGRKRLEDEIIYRYFTSVWQGAGRYTRTIEQAIVQQRLDIHAVNKRCREEVGFRARVLRQLIKYLDNRTSYR